MMNKWHDWLDMKQNNKQWYIDDLADEVTEYLEETNIIKKWFELSDVVYSYTSGKWAGYELSFPFKKWQYYLGLIYMFPKYTDRWLFFRYAGRKADSQNDLHELSNPLNIGVMLH